MRLPVKNEYELLLAIWRLFRESSDHVTIAFTQTHIYKHTRMHARNARTRTQRHTHAKAVMHAQIKIQTGTHTTACIRARSHVRTHGDGRRTRADAVMHAQITLRPVLTTWGVQKHGRPSVTLALTTGLLIRHRWSTPARDTIGEAQSATLFSTVITITRQRLADNQRVGSEAAAAVRCASLILTCEAHRSHAKMTKAYGHLRRSSTTLQCSPTFALFTIHHLTWYTMIGSGPYRLTWWIAAASPSFCLHNNCNPGLSTFRLPAIAKYHLIKQRALEDRQLQTDYWLFS